MRAEGEAGDRWGSLCSASSALPRLHKRSNSPLGKPRNCLAISSKIKPRKTESDYLHPTLQTERIMPSSSLTEGSRTLFDDREAMRIERGAQRLLLLRMEMLTGRAQPSCYASRLRDRPSGASVVRGSWPNIHDLHAGGGTHGRGMKRLPCPRPTTKRYAGTQDAAFLLRTTGSCPHEQMPNPRRAILRPHALHSIGGAHASRTAQPVRVRTCVRMLKPRTTSASAHPPEPRAPSRPVRSGSAPSRRRLRDRAACRRSHSPCRRARRRGSPVGPSGAASRR